MQNNFPYLNLPCCSFDSDTFFNFCGFLNMYISEYRLYIGCLSPFEIHDFVNHCNYFIQYLSLCISRFEKKYPKFSLDSSPED